MGGEHPKAGEEGEEKGNCWNWGELPCDNLFGNRKHGSESKPSTVWRRGQQPARDTLHVATAWIGKVSEMVLPSSFLHVPAFSAQGLLHPPGTTAPQSKG